MSEFFGAILGGLIFVGSLLLILVLELVDERKKRKQYEKLKQILIEVKEYGK